MAVSAKPKVVCHIDVCESLWVMGVREDQIVGYFYGSPSSWAGMCEGVHCKSAHYELIPDVSDGGTYGLDMYNGIVGDMLKLGVRESFKSKLQVLVSASEVRG